LETALNLDLYTPYYKTEQMMELLKAMQENMDDKTDATLREMKAEIRANNKTPDVILTTLVSQMDRGQDRGQDRVHSRRSASQDGHTSREDGGHNTLHPVRVMRSSNIKWKTSWRVSTKRRRTSAGN
jgi:hypothetical protein